MTTVSVTDLIKRFPPQNAGVGPLTLDVAAGEHLIVAGPSGAGKTTLLRLIAGLERPDAGRVCIGGRNVSDRPAHERGVAFVFQRPAIYPHLSVRRNLSISAELKRKFVRVSRGEIEVRVTEAAQLLDLVPLLDRRSDRLSGGEQQRVALGRAWVARALVWLLDEPLAHLDPALRANVREQMLLLRDRSGATIVEVTHDPGDALALGRRVAIVRAGRLEQVGNAAELYARPASLTVASALGLPPLNVAEGIVSGVDGHHAMQFGHGVTVPLPPTLGATAGSAGPFSLGVRPEHIMPAADGLTSLGEWRVTRSVKQGLAWLATVERPGLKWQAWLTVEPTAANLKLGMRTEDLLLFDSDGKRVE